MTHGEWTDGWTGRWMDHLASIEITRCLRNPGATRVGVLVLSDSLFNSEDHPLWLPATVFSKSQEITSQEGKELQCKL